MKKYKLTSNTKVVYGITLYQIQALKNFNDVKKDDLGGWVQCYSNLSQFDDCWVYDNGIVRNNAKVFDNGRVFGNGIVCDNGIGKNGYITSKRDLFSVSNIGSRLRATTFTKQNKTIFM